MPRNPRHSTIKECKITNVRGVFVNIRIEKTDSPKNKPDENKLGFGMTQDMLHGVSVKFGENGHGHGAHRRDRKISDTPVNTVFTQENDGIAKPDSLFGKPVGEGMHRFP